MKTSTYQLLKIHVLKLFSISHDAAHIHVGMLTFLVTLIFMRKKALSWKVLLPCLLVSVVMELFDLRDHLMVYNVFRPMSHLHDLLNTNFLPVLIYLLMRTKKIQLG